MSSVLATITIAIIISMKNKLKPSITLFISTVFKVTKLVINKNNSFYVIPVMFMLYTTQIKIYPCTISHTLIIFIVNEFIEHFQQITTKPFIAEMVTTIVYVNGKVLKPFIAIKINVAAVYVNGQDLLLCIMKLNSSLFGALSAISIVNKTKGVVHSATSITYMIYSRDIIAVVLSPINNAKFNSASLSWCTLYVAIREGKPLQ